MICLNDNKNVRFETFREKLIDKSAFWVYTECKFIQQKERFMNIMQTNSKQNFSFYYYFTCPHYFV